MPRVRQTVSKQTQYSYEDHYEDYDYDDYDEHPSLNEYEYNPEGNYLSIGELDHYSDDSNDYDDYGEAYGYSDNEEDNVDQVNHTKFNKEEEKINLCLDQLFEMLGDIDVELAVQLLKENNYSVGIVSKYLKCITPNGGPESKKEQQDSTDSSSKKTQFKSISLPSSKNETQASKNDKSSTNSEVVKEPSKKEIYNNLINKKYTLENEILKNSKTSGIQPFSFDTLSPDDAVRQARENGDYSTNATLGIEKELHILDRTHSIPSSHGKPSNQSVLDMYIEPSNEQNKSLSPLSESVPPIKTPSKPSITLVIAGHVDAGKSTVTGHLLYNKGIVEEKVLRKYEKQCKEIGKNSFQYAWIMDEGEERERGVTIDLGIRYLETDNKFITLLDAPGHRDFINNMISGAFQCDVGVIIISASKGEFEAGSSDQGQTREHIVLMKGIGVDKLIICINKMDSVDWSQERYMYIQTQLNALLKTYSFKSSNITYIPISGIFGDNLTSPSEHMTWYSGPTLMEVIDSCPVPDYNTSAPLRIAISDVYKSDVLGPAIAGKVITGVVSTKQKYMIIPGMKKTTVKNMLVGNKKVNEAHAGMTVELGIDEDINTIRPGCVLYDVNTTFKPCKKFQAHIFTLPNLKVPLFKGTTMLLYSHSNVQPVVITHLISMVDKSGKELSKKPKYNLSVYGIEKNRFVPANKFSIIEFKCDKLLCLEPFSECSGLGRIMLRDNGVTYALGKVVRVFEDVQQKSPRNDKWDDF